MTRNWMVCTTAFLVLCVTTAAEARQYDPLTPQQVAQVKEQVVAAINDYYRLYSPGDKEQLPRQAYNVPLFTLSAQGPQIALTREDIVRNVENNITQLTARGWGKSVFTTDHVCVLTINSAFATGRNTRYKTDGSVLEVNGTSYLYGRTKEGWRIVAMMPHRAGMNVTCQNP